MFPLVRYFSLTAGVAILLATTTLSYVFYQHEVSRMIDEGERQNIITARLIANSLHPQLLEVLAEPAQGSSPTPPITLLNEHIRRTVDGLPIVKVKFYSLSGITHFSSEFVQIGEDKSTNPGFLRAAGDGEASSQLTYRDQFSAFSHDLFDIAVVETYIPMRQSEAGGIEAVFEIYSDVTTLVESINQRVMGSFALLFIVFALLYSALFVLVRHADRILKGQYTSLEEIKEAIRKKNEHLEQEIINREQAEAALKSANDLLEYKVEKRTEKLEQTLGELQLEIHQRRLAENSLKMLSTAVEQSPSSVIITDPTGIIEYANPRFYQVSGYTSDEVLGQNSSLMKSGKMPKQIYQDLWKTIERGDEWRGEMLNQKKDGTEFWEAISISPITDDQGQISHYVEIKEDISLRKIYEDELLYQANYDHLTGLANRLLVKDRLKQAIARAQRDSRKVAILFIDLDDFKKVNDTLGHTSGDRLLVESAQRLQSSVRKTDSSTRKTLPEGDTVARLGGDEFVIILTDVNDPLAVEQIAFELLQTMEQPFEIEGHELHLSVSIGITLYPDDSMDTESLMRNADLAMYQAKESGRGTFRFFKTAFNDQAMERLSLEGQLRYAIENRELQLHYQPIIHNGDNRIAGAEALLRWHNHQLGSISPARFIPIAETTGLIMDIGYWVLEQGFRDLPDLSQRSGCSDFYLSINVSTRQLQDEGFTEKFLALIERYGIDLHRLKIEITESLILEETRNTQDNLSALAAAGVLFVIDDFGTGFSSLKYLKKFPVDALKIDRSFVSDVCIKPDDATLVRSISAMAHSLDIKVIAEGVETPEQQQFIIETGCQYTQGFLTGRPVPIESFNLVSAQVTAYEKPCSTLSGSA